MPNSQLQQLQLQVEALRNARVGLNEALISPNTRSNYRYDWQLFERWCEAMNLTSLPATEETLCLYIVAVLNEGKKITTARRRCCSIAHYHTRASMPNPITRDVLDVLVGAQRQRREKPRQMRPLTLDQMRRISISLSNENSAKAIRDRALMLIGFASALRRSSIAELRIEDAEFTAGGLVLHIQHEKQDQLGKGRMIGIPPGKHPETCAIAALQQWLSRRGTAPGPLFPRLTCGRRGEFMDGEAVYRVVKNSVARIGLDPGDRYGGHSLRSGFITAAGESGAGELLIASQSGHKNMQVLRRYFRRTEVFRANACTVLDF